MRLSGELCSGSQSCSLHSRHSPAQRVGRGAEAARPALIRGIHRYRAFTGRGGQSGSALMRVLLCSALKVSPGHPARQEHWSKLACSYWNAIHSRHCTCNLLLTLTMRLWTLAEPNGQLKGFWCNSGEATVKAELQKRYNGWISRNVWLAQDQHVYLCRWKYICHLCSLNVRSIGGDTCCL